MRTFIETPTFTRKWVACGLTDDDLRTLENVLLRNPKTGEVIQETSGIRKIRIPCNERGKRAGGRVIYVDIEIKEKIYLLDIYVKNEKIDLTKQEKMVLRKLVNVLKEE